MPAAASLSSRARFALLGVLATGLVAEGVARIQGDRLCLETPGAVYQADPRFGWTHVPGLRGWVGRCGGDSPLPAVALETSTTGLRDLERPMEKPPETARILLLGGNLPEGLGVVPHGILPRWLESFADQRAGRRLEVINAGIGGFSLDQDLLYFRHEAVRFAPDLVLVVLNPVSELPSLSPFMIKETGQAIPAKPFFSFMEGGQLTVVEVKGDAPADPAALARDSVFARSQLYRRARGIPTRSGPPLAWADPTTLGLPPSDLQVEHERAADLARALLQALRDETAAAGARLVLALAPSHWGTPLPEAEGGDAELLLGMAADLGIPAVDMSERFRHLYTTKGESGYFPGSVRWDLKGHFVAGGAIWGFLVKKRLLPEGVVSAPAFFVGRPVPLSPFPQAFLDAAWGERQGLFARFVQYGLIAVGLTWAGVVLPAALRTWWQAAIGVGLLAGLGTWGAALALVAAVVLFWMLVERVPGRIGVVAIGGFLLAFVLVPVAWLAEWLPGTAADDRLAVALVTNVLLLRLIAYARDRRQGQGPARLRDLLAGAFFFPTVLAGPIETVAEVAAHRADADAALDAPGAFGAQLRTSVRALGRLLLGTLKVAAALLVLGALTAQVFGSGGMAVTRLRLWLWVLELPAWAYAMLSGTSDIVIALGALVGVRVSENFRAPWAATDPADFWRRWHVSLGRWLRTYVYLPLGGSREDDVSNVIVVFLLSALWHLWAALKIADARGDPAAPWQGMLLWVAFNAAAVLLVHWSRRRAAARAGVNGGRLATLAFMVLVCVPTFMPGWLALADLGAVVLVLFGLR